MSLISSVSEAQAMLQSQGVKGSVSSGVSGFGNVMKEKIGGVPEQMDAIRWYYGKKCAAESAPFLMTCP